MKKLFDFILSPNRWLLFLFKKTSGLYTDEMFCRILFRLKMGKKLNLKHPETFNEKLQWLKLFNRRPEYTMMVDKFAVKQ